MTGIARPIEEARQSSHFNSASTVLEARVLPLQIQLISQVTGAQMRSQTAVFLIRAGAVSAEYL
ncbi:hypothetical protein EV580_4755 [Mycobacterium sp. BK086]|nr:hypothetical protein EV580_4755 [Mycobacterium sp. BK086]